MPEFKLVKRIPSCSVNKGLLSDIEAYLKIEMSNKIGWELGNHISYNISIKEKVGTETLAGIGEYTPSIFADGTKEIVIHWGNGYGGTYRLDITIDFDGQLLSSGKLEVSCTAPTARETAIGIGDNILRLIESHRTYNWVFGPSNQIMVPLFSGGLFLFLVIYFFGNMMAKPKEGLWLLAAAAFVGWIGLSGLYFRPFISFNTRRQQLLDRLWRYFSLGIFGFVLFGTLLPLLRKALVGF